MPNYPLIHELVLKDKSTISFLYNKKDKCGIFFSELFIYGKVKNLDEKEVLLKLKCAYNSSCKFTITNSNVRMSFKKNYLGRFKLVNNDDVLYFKANLGRKIIDVLFSTDKFKKSFRDDIINQPTLYNQFHTEKVNTLNSDTYRELFETVKTRKSSVKKDDT